MRQDLPRIYVDFNTMMQDDDSRVWIPTRLHPELLEVLALDARIVLFDETLEVEATVEQLGPDEWWARPDPDTYHQSTSSNPWVGVEGSSN